MSQQPNDLVITGCGVVTAPAKSRAALGDALQGAYAGPLKLEGFDAAPMLSNRKLLKAAAWYHGYGLAAVEECRRDAALAAGAYQPEAIGLFVGAPPSSCFDNVNYTNAVRQSVDPATGMPSETAFGKTSQSALGTTILKGLPNNVLCYGAIILDAKGPNSNYLAGETSGHLSLIAAARNLRLGRLGAAMAGAYAYPTDAIVTSMQRQAGNLREGRGDRPAPFAVSALDAGTVGADGAVFLMLERRDGAEKRGAKVQATYLGAATASAGTGPCSHDDAAFEGLAHAARNALAQAGAAADQIGLVWVTGSGLPRVDAWELAAVDQLFAGAPKPAVASLAPVFGHLMEAGGLLECVLAGDLYRAGEVPAALSMGQTRFGKLGFTGTRLSADKPLALVLRAGAEGDFTAVVVRP